MCRAGFEPASPITAIDHTGRVPAYRLIGVPRSGAYRLGELQRIANAFSVSRLAASDPMVSLRVLPRRLHTLFLPLKRHDILFLPAVDLIGSGLPVILSLHVGTGPGEIAQFNPRHSLALVLA